MSRTVYAGLHRYRCVYNLVPGDLYRFSVAYSIRVLSGSPVMFVDGNDICVRSAMPCKIVIDNTCKYRPVDRLFYVNQPSENHASI